MTAATCTRCKARKPIGEFHVDPASASGYHTHCKACRSESARSRRQARMAGGTVTELPKRKPEDLDQRPELLSPPASEVSGVGPHLAELEATLATLDLGEADRALVVLCRTLARGLDFAHGDAREIALISPKYLQALKALCATRDTAPAKAEEGSSLRLAAY